ncbi:MAG: hypothetical protein ACREIC_25990 [Limisphaerales bacterium]
MSHRSAMSHWSTTGILPEQNDYRGTRTAGLGLWLGRIFEHLKKTKQ